VWLCGCKSVMMVVLLVVLAWGMGDVCNAVHTGDYLYMYMGPIVTPELLPTITFIFCALLAFITGTTYGIIAIMYPLALPLAHHLAPSSLSLLYGVISACVCGCVFGGHCSPICESTIEAGRGCGCVDSHVETQMPYAVVVAVITTMFGFLANGFGVYNQYIAMCVCCVCVVLVVVMFGKEVPDYCLSLKEEEVYSSSSSPSSPSSASSPPSSFEPTFDPPIPPSLSPSPSRFPRGEYVGNLDEECLASVYLKQIWR